MESITTTTITATVLQVCCCSLLVCDCSTRQRIQVHTDDACCFHAGDCVSIEFSGAMTMSIPPQITADHIHCINRC